MRIGALSSMNYVSRVNMLDPGSMGSVQPIPDDVLKQKNDYSFLLKEDEMVNPLKLGQSLNYEDILSIQMESGRANAARLFPEEPENDISFAEELAEKIDDLLVQDADPEQNQFVLNQNAVVPEEISNPVQGLDVLHMVQAFVRNEGPGMEYLQQGISRYKVNRGLEAYSMQMIG